MRRILVTGAARGLGLAFTRAALERGDIVVACPRTHESLGGLEALESSRLTIVPMDIGDPQDVRRASQEIIASVGGLEVLLNSAGVSSRSFDDAFARGARDLRSLSATVLETMFRINALGPLMVTQALLPLLRSGARVVNISSQRGSLTLTTDGNNYGYCATKAALNSFTRNLAADLAPSGIVAVMVHPGWVRTDMGGPKADLSPEEAASAILALADGLTIEDSGRFLTWEGEDHPW